MAKKKKLVDGESFRIVSVASVLGVLIPLISYIVVNSTRSNDLNVSLGIPILLYLASFIILPLVCWYVLRELRVKHSLFIGVIGSIVILLLRGVIGDFLFPMYPFHDIRVLLSLILNCVFFSIIFLLLAYISKAFK